MTFRPLPRLPAWPRPQDSAAPPTPARAAVVLCRNESEATAEWPVDGGWLDCFVAREHLAPEPGGHPDEPARYDWTAHIPSRAAADAFFAAAAAAGDPAAALAVLTPSAVLMAERLQLRSHTPAYWESITADGLLATPRDHALELLHCPSARRHMCVVATFLVAAMRRDSSIVLLLPDDIAHLFFYQVWVPIDNDHRYTMELRYNFSNYWRDDVFAVVGTPDGCSCGHIEDRSVHSPELRVMLWRQRSQRTGRITWTPTGSDAADYAEDPEDPPPIHIKHLGIGPAVVTVRYPEVKGKTVFLSTTCTLTVDDSFFIFNGNIVFSDMNLPAKDEVMATATGRLVVKEGHRIHVSDQCVRVRFELLYTMAVQWRTIHVPDEILDFGPFRTGFVVEYVTVATDHRIFIYRIPVGINPFLVASLDTSDRIVVSFERYNNPYYGTANGGARKPVFPSDNCVCFTDGRDSLTFRPPRSLVRTPVHTAMPRFTARGIDQHTRVLGYGFYGMYTPDLPTPAGGGPFNIYYRIVNYVAQYDSAGPRECAGHVNVANRSEQIRAELS